MSEHPSDRDGALRTLADLGDMRSFHRFVKKSYYHTEPHGGVGAACVCEFVGGRQLRWVPPSSKIDPGSNY